MPRRKQRQVIVIAILTAAMVSLDFLLAGHFILTLLGISVDTFAIAGGLILVILSIKFMISDHMVELINKEMMAVVPIGTPLLTRLTIITTLQLLNMQFPTFVVVVSHSP